MGCLLQVVCLASSQMNAEKFSEEVVKLGKPAVSAKQAVQIAKNLLHSLGVPAPKQALTSKLKPRIINRSAVGSQWIITGGDFELSVSGQSGQVLRFANIPALDRISRAQMVSRKSAFDGAVRPLFATPPPGCLIGKKSVLTRTGKVIVALRPAGTYIELVDGLPVTNASDTVAFQFDPKTGVPIFFSRALDFKLRPSGRQISAGQANALAGKIPAKKLVTARELPDSGGAPLELGYFVVEPLPSAHARYIGEATKAVRCWTIRTKTTVLWLEASSGAFLGGVKQAKP